MLKNMFIPTHYLRLTEYSAVLYHLRYRAGTISAAIIAEKSFDHPLIYNNTLLSAAPLRRFIDLHIQTNSRFSSSIAVCVPPAKKEQAGLIIQLTALFMPLSIPLFCIITDDLFAQKTICFYRELLLADNLLAPVQPTPLIHALTPLRRLSSGFMASLITFYIGISGYALYATTPIHQTTATPPQIRHDTSAAQLLALLSIACPPNVKIHSLNCSPLRIILQSAHPEALYTTYRVVKSFFSSSPISCKEPAFCYGLPPFYKGVITATSCFNSKTLYHETPALEKISAHI